MTPPAANTSRWSILGWLLLMGAAWGLEFSMLKLAAEAGFPGTGVLLVTLALVAAVLCAILTLRGGWFLPDGRTFVFLLVIALLGYVLPLLAALWAAPRVPAGTMTLIASFTPVVTVATALLLRTEAVSARRIVAVGLGLAAALLVLLPEASLPSGGSLIWLLVVFVVPLTYGVESVYVAVAWPQGIDPLQVATGQSLVTLVLLLPIHLAFGGAITYDPAWPAGQAAILVVAACVLVEVLLYFLIISRTGGVLVSFSMYLSLFAGIAWGWAIFGERLGAAVWLATAVLAAGLALTVPPRERPDP